MNFNYEENNLITNPELFCLSLISFFLMKNIYSSNLKIINEKDTIKLKGHSYEIVSNSSRILKNFVIWNEIHSQKKSNVDLEEIEKIFQHSMELLFIYKIFKKKKISWKNKSYLIFYETSPLTGKNYTENEVLNYYPYKIYEDTNIYIYSNHYATIEQVFRPNAYSSFSLVIQNKNILFENLCNNWVYLDRKKLEYTFIHILEKKKIKKENIYCEYQSLINIQNILLENKDYRTAIKIAKKMSEYEILFDIKNILDEKFDNLKIYIPFFFDFRGRLYYSSKLSPTFNKHIRNCIHWGPYENLECEYHTNNEKIENILKDYWNELKNLKFIDIENKTSNIKNSLIWLTISAAESEKSKMGKKVHILEFIKKGIQILNNFDGNNYFSENIEDYLKTHHVYSIIKELDKGVYIKWLISKDATASVYQHLIKTLGRKNNSAFEWCNLKNNAYWFDTYSFIIDIFKENTKLKYLSIEEFNETFCRAPLKKTIMTKNYGAKYKRCWDDFKSYINDDKYTYDKITEIETFFKQFYKYLEKEENLLENESEAIIKYISNNNFTIETSDSVKINFKYFKQIIKQVELNYPHRPTKQKIILKLDEIDFLKIKNSIRANYIHALDGSLVRWYLTQHKGVSIHDCFMVDYLNITYLVSKINEGMKITFHDIKIKKNDNLDDLFSIFIIL